MPIYRVVNLEGSILSLLAETLPDFLSQIWCPALRFELLMILLRMA
jgi:hypothetical protein